MKEIPKFTEENLEHFDSQDLYHIIVDIIGIQHLNYVWREARELQDKLKGIHKRASLVCPECDSISARLRG